jgi:hypothetical protein
MGYHFRSALERSCVLLDFWFEAIFNVECCSFSRLSLVVAGMVQDI